MTASVPTSQETGQSNFFLCLLLQWLEWLDNETYTAWIKGNIRIVSQGLGSNYCQQWHLQENARLRILLSRKKNDIKPSVRALSCFNIINGDKAFRNAARKSISK